MTELHNRDDAGFLVILKHILKWRKPILIISAVAAIAAVVFSMPYFMTPKFKSTTVFYPASSGSVGKGLFSKDVGQKADILAFGEEEEAEQLLQILESDAISNRIIAKYNLMERYEIEQDDPYKNTNLTLEYYSNVSFKRNEHLAIEVSVYDADPQVAANMANDIADLMDSVKSQIQKERAKEALQIVEDEFKRKELEIKAFEDTLAALGKKGVINNNEQAATITESYDKARTDYYNALAGNPSKKQLDALGKRLEEAKADYDKLAKYGGKWQSISEGLILEREQFERLKEKYAKAKVDVEREMSSKFTINRATPAEKKAKPIRSLIVMLSVFSAFLLSSLAFVVYEVFKENRDWLLNK